MTQAERQQIKRVIAKLESDYGHEDAMRDLYKMAKGWTNAERDEKEKTITEASDTAPERDDANPDAYWPAPS